MGKLTLDLDAIKVTTFETATVEATSNNAATVYTGINCCGGTGCNTRLTCSTNLC